MSRHPVIKLLALGPSLASILGVWWLLGRPVTIAEPAVGHDERLQCVSYTPFAGSESPFQLDHGLHIAPERIRSDLRLLAQHFRCVRTYSVNGLEEVPAIARGLGMQVLLGAWVNADAKATQREITRVIALARRYPKTVRAVIVGNEVLLRHELTGPQLAAWIREVKAGIAQPVTYADVWEYWLKHPQIAQVTDFVTIHILPYWENKPVPVDRAVAHVAAVYRDVAQRIPGERILIGETGWPSRGRMREGALPSAVNQARFIRGFVALAQQHRWNYNLIEAFDQPWKRVHEGTVGGYWGLYDTQRRDKHVLAGAVSQHPEWRMLAGISSLVLLGLLAAIGRGQPDSRALTLMFGAATAAAVALGLQFEQYWYAARSASAWFWAMLVLLTAFGVIAAALRDLGRGLLPTPTSLRATLETLRVGRWRDATGELFVTALCMEAAVISLGLVFDPRYRSFPLWSFIAAAIVVAARTVVERGRGVRLSMGQTGREETALGLLLIACGVVVTINESLRNWQALTWTLACVLLGGTLLSRIPRRHAH